MSSAISQRRFGLCAGVLVVMNGPVLLQLAKARPAAAIPAFFRNLRLFKVISFPVFRHTYLTQFHKGIFYQINLAEVDFFFLTFGWQKVYTIS